MKLGFICMNAGSIVCKLSNNGKCMHLVLNYFFSFQNMELPEVLTTLLYFIFGFGVITFWCLDEFCDSLLWLVPQFITSYLLRIQTIRFSRDFWVLGTCTKCTKHACIVKKINEQSGLPEKSNRYITQLLQESTVKLLMNSIWDKS